MNRPANQMPAPEQKPPQGSAMTRFLDDIVPDPAKVSNGSVPDKQTIVPPSRQPAPPAATPPAAPAPVEKPATRSLFEDKPAEENNTPPAPPAENKSTAPVEDTITDETTDEEIEHQADTDEHIRVNYKRLAKHNRDLKKQRKSETSEYEKAQERLAQYESGLVQPEKLAELQAEVARLKPLEAIVNFRVSKEREDNFTIPFKTKMDEAKEYAKNYNIPPNLIEGLLDKSQAERDVFISKYFDRLPGDKVDKLLSEALDIRTRESEALSDAENSLESLRLQRVERERVESETFIGKTTNQVEHNWVDVLAAVQKENKIANLCFIEGNEEHNNSVSAIHTQAAADYARGMREAVQGGMKKLSPEFMKYMARMNLYAQSAAVLEAERDAAVSEAERLRQASQSRTTRIRPPLGKSSSDAGNSSAGSGKPAALKDRVSAGIRTEG